MKVHYHGTLLNGTVFDSSVQRGEPLEIGVGEGLRRARTRNADEAARRPPVSVFA